MKRNYRVLLCGALLAVSAGTALADGDGGDNSMSQWTGESYAAFYGGNVGDFVTPRERAAVALTPAEAASEQAVALLDRHGVPINPFRDDTAA